MHRSSAVWVLVALLGAPSLATAEEGRKSRRSSSESALWSIQMVEPGAGKCRLEATKDRDIAWTLERCVGTADDVYFISNDGQRFWVLRTLPEKPAPRVKKGKKWVGRHWWQAEVAAQYEATGKKLESHALSRFLPKHKRSEVKQLKLHFKWLEGVAGERGVAPRLEQGQIEFETLAGKTHQIAFEKKQD